MRRLAIFLGVCLLAVGVALAPTRVVAADIVSADAAPAKEVKKDKEKKEAGKKKDKKPAAEAAKPAVKDTAAAKDAPAKEAAKPVEPAAKPAEAGAKPAATAGKPDAASAAAAAKPSTYKVKKRPMKIETSLDGVFEAKNATEYTIRSKDWTDYEVLKAVEHGSRVREGDLLITLDTEKIDRAIGDFQRDITLLALAAQDAEITAKTLQTTTNVDFALNDRSRRIALEDYDYYFNVERPFNEKALKQSMKSAEDMLAYEEEELKQLEKMYKADDLVEETEEIVLKRARDQVERARFMLERTKLQIDAMARMTIPRTEELMKLTRDKIDLDWQKGKIAVPVARQKADLALEKAKLEHARALEKLKRLQADREKMIIKAPTSGIVYYGRCLRGKWSSTETVADKLRRGGRLMNEDVVLTIVDPRPMVIRTSVAEKQLPNVRAGLKGFATPTSSPDSKLPTMVERIAAVPTSTGTFDTTVAVTLDDSASGILPGMNCEVRMVSYFNRDAIAVPASAVGTDDLDPRKTFINRLGKDGKPEKREVVVGKRTDKLVEILKGVAEGDEIQAEFSKD